MNTITMLAETAQPTSWPDAVLTIFFTLIVLAMMGFFSKD